MKREVAVDDLKKLYTAGDMARVGCNGCQGCCDCCRGMGSSVVLDPLDIYRLVRGLQMDFSGLMEKYLELNAVDGVVLPNLQMASEKECCGFLNEEGRCAIHAFRPGLCRLFPLGRYYENGTFRYFLQKKECRMEPKTKVRISKWLGEPELKKYEAYILAWHNLLEEIQELLAGEKDEQLAKDMSVYLLNSFYIKGYRMDEEFYVQFEERREQMEKLLSVLKRK
ncbi:MAG: YkgJ family cysteine cluster protein [Eubacteriales bacterium]|nr:YkgJ family cysteine cluster protein [Eubacteriales bacterium]